MSGYATTGPLAARIAIHGYGTNPTHWYDFVRGLLPPADRLLDAGAGTGALWGDAPPRGLVAVDSSPAMCAALTARDVPVVRASADRLPFAAGSFDGAVCNHVLYHLPTPAAALGELRRVLRPGGWVAVATNGTGHMAEFSALGKSVGLPPSDVHEHFPAERAAEAVAEHFVDVVVHRYDDTLAVPDAEPVVAYLASLSPAPLTSEQEAALRAGAAGGLVVRKHTVLVLGRRADRPAP